MTNYPYNMKEIPQNCIDFFLEKFGTFPSIIDVSSSMNEQDSDKFYGKHHLIWYESFVNSEYKSVYQNRLYEYDSTGILILRKSNTKIFILTKVDKQNAVDFLLQQIKRLTTKKD